MALDPVQPAHGINIRKADISKRSAWVGGGGAQIKPVQRKVKLASPVQCSLHVACHYQRTPVQFAAEKIVSTNSKYSIFRNTSC